MREFASVSKDPQILVYLNTLYISQLGSYSLLILFAARKILKTTMKRGGSGGGQSSLGYLFGSEEEKPKNEAPPPSQTTYAPPYGIDISTDEKPPSQDKTKVISNDYIRVHGQNSGNFITVCYQFTRSISSTNIHSQFYSGLINLHRYK